MSEISRQPLADWETQAKKEKKTDDLSALTWQTPEGDRCQTSLHRRRPGQT